MSIREDMETLERKTKELEKQTLAMEIYSDYKKTNTRLFVIWIITFIALIGLSIYTISLLEDISVVETTEVSQETEEGNNNYIGNDGDIINGETDS